VGHASAAKNVGEEDNDVLTNIRGSHTFKFGYEGWFGDDVEEFQGRTRSRLSSSIT